MSPTEPSPGPHPGRPSRWLVAWCGVCVVVAAAAFAVGLSLTSPWDDAVANATTVPQVTARVEQRELQAPGASALGTASTGALTDVIPVASEAQLVVTATPKAAGARVAPGQMLVEVSGRPIIALPLPFPLYRDLTPGDSGSDVRAVQQALTDLGLYSAPIDGSYGASTEAAVRALYAGAGAVAPQAPDQARSALTEAESALRAAQSEGADGAALAPLVRAAQEARATAGTPLPMIEIVAVSKSGATVASVQPVGTRLGDEQAAVAQLRSGTPSAAVRVGVADAKAFAQGAKVDVVAVTDTGVAAVGTVSMVSEFRAADDTNDLPGYDVTIHFTGKTEFEDGAAVTAHPTGEDRVVAGLTVPTVAVRQDGATAYVLVRDGETDRSVDVVVELAVDGYSLVSGLGIAEGVTVVIGAS